MNMERPEKKDAKSKEVIIIIFQKHTEFSLFSWKILFQVTILNLKINTAPLILNNKSILRETLMNIKNLKKKKMENRRERRKIKRNYYYFYILASLLKI